MKNFEVIIEEINVCINQTTAVRDDLNARLNIVSDALTQLNEAKTLLVKLIDD